MNYKSLLALFVSGLLFATCSKDKDDANLYQTGSTMTIDQLAIYTHDGIISDPAVIQGFLDRNFSQPETQKWFYVNQKTVNDHIIRKTMKFLDNNRIEFNRQTMEIISKTDTLMLIAELNETDVPGAQTAKCDKLLETVPAITPTTYCSSNTCTKYRKTYPILISGGNYYLPTLYYAVSNTERKVVNGLQVIEYCGKISQDYPMLNFVKKDLSSSLDINDSILVQTGKVPLVKN